MFTGLVEELGTVREVRRRGEGMILSVAASAVLDDLKVGDSIAVNGACLTVALLKGEVFSAELSGETLDRTTLKEVKAGDRVNLERPLRPTDRLGGHFVTGHVDGVGKIHSIVPLGEMREMVFQVPKSLIRYLVPKGSVAVDGVSLTVNAVTEEGFKVTVIPHTAAVTTLGLKRPGDPVNLETDLLGKYVERFLMGEKPGGGIDRGFLIAHGYLRGRI
jgi:riboflavin synthase